MDSEKGKAKMIGKEGQLFAWEIIQPYDADRNDLVWKTAVDFPGDLQGDELAAVKSDLARVFSQLGFLSKTKATATVSFDDEPAVSAFQISSGGLLALRLVTPALLADPRVQESNGGESSGHVREEDLHQLYAQVWNELSGGALTLSHFYASQSLLGGHYLHKRFQKDSPYNPWLLTDPGSIFVFEVGEASKAEALIDLWLSSGLPIPQKTADHFGNDWQTNPFIPANGFGEVAIHQVHPEFALPEGAQLIPICRV